MEFSEQFRKNSEGIGDRATVDAGVQIAHRSGEFDLIVVQAAQTVGDGGNTLGQHGGIGNDEGIGFKFFAIFLDVLPQTNAANFLFALDEYLYVNSKLTVQRFKRFESLQVDMYLAFIVGGAAAKQISVAHGRLEGRGGPQIERLGGLHVIVAVKKNGGFARSFERFRIHERVQTGGDNFNRFKPGFLQAFGHPAGGALDIRLVLAFGADAGNAQKFAKFCQMLIAASINKLSKIHKRPGAISPFV